MTQQTEKTPEKHLWEYKHPYYCHDENYCGMADERLEPYGSWAEFFEDWGDSDLDYNLVFRWDWKVRDEDWKEDHEEGEPEPPEHILYIYFILQRKGHFRPVKAIVCPEDEPAVRAWLTVRVSHLMSVNEGV